MSESDSSIPQKVADLANALGGVRLQIFQTGRLFHSFQRWYEATGEEAILRYLNPLDGSQKDGSLREGSEDVLDAAAEFVEAVATADQMLNATPVSALEPLSGLAGGVPWDLRTRRALRAIRHETAILECHSRDPEGLLSGLWWMGDDRLNQMRSKLTEIDLELKERIIDLQAILHPNCESNYGKVNPPPDGNPPSVESTGGETMAKTGKRSTKRGDGREKLISALTKHHKYADGSCLNQEPIGNNELAKLANVSKSTASEFFRKAFGGTEKYRAACSKLDLLIPALKLLNNEFSPHLLFGDNPPEAAANPEYKSDRHRKPRSSELGHNSD
jgi:hypothetical protein